ncbi:MAG: hypothetical protein [Circular genetic element sp.]|nr:MAG: hypothetical protein [Circular genetic element sp.]
MRLSKISTNAIKNAVSYSTNPIAKERHPGSMADPLYKVWVMVYDENNTPTQLHCSTGPMLYDSYSRAARAVERLNPAIRWKAPAKNANECFDANDIDENSYLVKSGDL